MDIMSGDSVDDINLRWQDCFGRLNDNLFHIKRVHDYYGEDIINISYDILTENKWVTIPCTDVPIKDIDMSFVPLRNVDIGLFSVVVRQCAQRSYRLGLCDARVGTKVVSSDMANKLNKNIAFSLGVVYPRLVMHKYSPIEQSVDEIMSRKVISRSIDEDYSLGVSNKTRLLGLYRGGRLIGELNPSNLDVLLPYKHRYFIDELQERGHEVILGEN